MTKFSCKVQPVNGWKDKNYPNVEWMCVVTENDKVIWESEHLEKAPKFERNHRTPWAEWHEKKNNLIVLGENWLDNHHPNWRNE